MSKLSTFILGVVAGAVVVPIIGFTALGWKLEAKAQIMASDAAYAEVQKVLLPVCLAQFNADPDTVAHTAAFKAKDQTHLRVEYIERGGWATLLGQSQPVSGLARSCSDALEKAL